jgi:hypothetical protein
MKDTKKLAPAIIKSYVAAIRHFYDINEIDLNWKKIQRFRGEFYNVVEDRPYTREEIRTPTVKSRSARQGNYFVNVFSRVAHQRSASS